MEEKSERGEGKHGGRRRKGRRMDGIKWNGEEQNGRKLRYYSLMAKSLCSGARVARFESWCSSHVIAV